MTAEAKTKQPKHEISAHQQQALGSILNYMRRTYGSTTDQAVRNREVVAALNVGRHQLQAEQGRGEDTAAFEVALSSLAIGAVPAGESTTADKTRLQESPLLTDEEKIELVALGDQITGMRGQATPDQQVSETVKGAIESKLANVTAAIELGGDTAQLPYQTALLGMAAGASISTLAHARDFDHGTAFMAAVRAQTAPQQV